MLLILLLLISILFIVISTSKFHLHPFLALLFAAVGFGLFARMPLTKIVESINGGFGETIGKIGIVIIAGIIIGTFLERSGGAFAIAERILKIIGEKHVPLAMSIIGYIVSIPVFADSGFVILAPLNRALSKRAKISLVGPVVALAVGLTATHCLVPPTPGPIAAAGMLDADLGLVIFFSLIVSAFALVVGWVFAVKFASKIYIEPNPELSEADVEARLKEAPTAFKAFIPIVVPIFLIVAKSIADYPKAPDGLWQSIVKTTVVMTGEPFIASLKNIVGFIGEPVIALLIGVLLSFRLPRKLDMRMLSTTGWLGQSLLSAAIIIMITGAGGAFGMVLRNSPIADVLSKSLSKANLGIWLPFIIAAAIKSAQGSSTVALITTASLMSPLMSSLGFESGIARALVVLSIGAGSMVVSHANDSFFWVVTQMSGMDVKTGYKTHTLATLIIGVTSALVVWIMSLIVL
ncbi:MAG: GntP family permease [Sedimentisphaerales bacterium]|nr:GntP family permease [Sedimentisphaerales bacterium]